MPRRPNNAAETSKPQPPSKRIRDLRRLLKKKDLPDDLREQKLKELEELEALKGDNKTQKPKSVKQETKFARKYRMVKFFERRKLLRYIERIEKKLSEVEEDSTEAKTLQEKLDQYNKDMIYVKYYPKDCKYISILKECDDKETEIEREKMRKRAEHNAALAAARRKERNEKEEEEEEDEESEGEGESGDEDEDDSDKDDFFL